MTLFAQGDFSDAIRDSGRAIPGALAPAGGMRPERRFSVYRNNVAVSFKGALETRFPAVRKIVGEAFFAELARAYVAEHPPRSPLMMTFGDDFADFLEAAPGLNDVEYLGDVARLEAARTRAYHAADADPLGPHAFAALDPHGLSALAFALHPSVEIVRSSHPVVTIWAMNAGEAELGPIADWRGQDALVSRPRLDVSVRGLPRGGGAFLDALSRGEFLGAAAEAAHRADPEFDLTQNLIGLIEAGLAIGLSHKGNPS